MRNWVIGLLIVCLVLSLALNGILAATYPVVSQSQPEIIYVPVEKEEERTGHAGLFVRRSPMGDELDYQSFWVHGEHWVSINSQPTLCSNHLNSRSAWLSLPEWQQAQVTEICEVTK